MTKHKERKVTVIKNKKNKKKIIYKRRIPKMNAVRKAKIPVALREQVWIKNMGKTFEGKCIISWCNNNITVFDFQCGHNIPESKGGQTTIQNLLPICGRCNLSMANNYTIDQWTNVFQEQKKTEEEVQPTKKVVEVVQSTGFWCC